MQLHLTTVGGSRTTVTIDEETCTVEALSQLVSKALNLPVDRLKLVAKGQPVTSLQSLTDGDSLLAMVVPRPPPRALREMAEGVEPQEDEDLKFQLPPDAPQWQRRLASVLQHRLRLPEVALVLLFSLGRKVWLGLLVWWVGARLASAYSVGPIYMVGSVFVLILSNLGRRKEGEASAYSIFNTGHRRLPGQLTAEHLEEQVRRGHF